MARTWRAAAPVAVLLAACCLALACPAAGAPPPCEALGFTSLLLCSDCKQLESFVKDDALTAECTRCCADASGGDEVFYTQAILEVCPRSMEAMPHIEEFVRDKAAGYPGLRVAYMVGVPPRLMLRDATGASTVVSVYKWKPEHLEDVLRDKLRPESGSGAAADADEE